MSPRMHVTTEDLADRWSFNDLMVAHEILNAFDDAEVEASRG